MSVAHAPLHERHAAFHKGQLVVHPTHGLCRIAGIESAATPDGEEECYVFRMGSQTNPVKVVMPAAQAEAGGLRRPVSPQQADEILQVFQQPATPVEPHSKEDLDAVAARLTNQDLCIVAAAIRDLVTAGVKGWLGQPEGSFSNQRRSEQLMLTEAVNRLTEELAYVQHTSRNIIEDRIRTCLGRTRRRRAPQLLRS